jgi:hypothetical protein
MRYGSHSCHATARIQARPPRTITIQEPNGTASVGMVGGDDDDDDHHTPTVDSAAAAAAMRATIMAQAAAAAADIEVKLRRRWAMFVCGECLTWISDRNEVFNRAIVSLQVQTHFTLLRKQEPNSVDTATKNSLLPSPRLVRMWSGIVLPAPSSSPFEIQHRRDWTVWGQDERVCAREKENCSIEID